MRRKKVKPAATPNMDAPATVAAEELRDEVEKEDFSRFAPPKGSGVGKIPGTDPGLERIAERLYKINIAETAQHLAEEIRVGNKRSDYATLQRVVDDAVANAKAANALYLNAKALFEEWEAEAAIVMAPMRSEATAALQAEKNAGERNKLISNADVEAKMAALYPDEFKAHAVKRAKLKGTVEHLQNDSELWAKQRCKHVDTMLATVRR